MDTPVPVQQEEDRWMRDVFRGDKMPEFTLSAVIAGVAIGVLVMAENVYMGLKTGITEAGSLLAAILSFALFRMMRKNFSILENNLTQSISSASGSIGIIVSVVPAMELLGHKLTPFSMFIWVLAVALFALLMAVPLRRRLIVEEQLTFPTGTACASTLTAMHSHGDGAIEKAKALGSAGLLAGIITWFRDGIPAIIPSVTFFPGSISGFSMEQLSLGVYWSPLVLGIGLLVSLKIGLSLLLGTALTWGVLGPWLANAHVIEKLSQTQVTHWTMWPAIGLMLASGFTSLAMKGGLISRTFRSMMRVSVGGNNLVEFPFSLWAGMLLVVLVFLLVITQVLFQIPWWLGLLAVIFAFAFSLVAMRAYGETDLNPVGTMGHANQILSSALMPGQAVANLAGGGVAAGCSDVAADLMQVLKTGHIVGASPRRQVIGQMIGVSVGSLIAVVTYLAVTQTYGLGSDAMPAPGAMPWSGMAKLLAEGSVALPPFSITAGLIGLAAGILIAVLEKRPVGKYLPSPFGVGIGLLVPGFIALSIFFVTVLGYIVERKFEGVSSRFQVSIASGAIAGEAIIGVLISILTMIGVLAG